MNVMLKPDSFFTIEMSTIAEDKISGSSFISLAFHVSTMEEIEFNLNATRKKYYDATHHCYTWSLFDPIHFQNETKSSDDGEPSGTAGKPILNVLTGSGQKMLADLAVAFGGRLAEEIVFGHEKVTTGAQSDIEQATRMARAMVTRFGMSDSLGPIAYAENQEEVFLGHSVSRTQNISEATAQKIDDEIHRIIDESYQRAKDILTSRQSDLNVLARGLLEYETLTGDEIIALLKGIPPVRTPYEDPVLPSRGEGTSVPVAGKSRPSNGPGPIISPEPQPR